MNKYPHYVIFLSISVFLLILSTIKLSNQDTYLHLKAGEYILQNGKIPYTDVFSYTAFGKPWVYHEWLFAVLIYVVLSLSSPEALSLFTAFLIFATFILLYRLILRQGTSPYLAIIITITAFLGSRFFFSLRPHQVSYLFIVLFLYILNRHADKKDKMIWILPLLIIPWANIHAGCIYGLALIGIYIFSVAADGMIREGGRKIPDILKEQGMLGGIFIISLSASLLNPYTYKVLTYPWEIMQFNATMFTVPVIEWRPTTFANYPHFYILFALTGLLMLPNFRSIKAVEVLLFLAFGYWGAKVERATVEFFLVTAPILGRHGQFLIDRWVKPYRFQSTSSRLKWAASLLFSGGVIYLGVISIERHGPNQIGVGINKEIVPLQAIRFIEEAGIGGNMYNDYGYGGYLIWFLYPKRLVFVDGRHDVHADYLKEAAYLSYEDLAQRYNLNYLVLGNARIKEEIPPLDKWVLVFWGDAGRVYLRRTAENLPLIERYGYKFLQPDHEDFGYLMPYINNPSYRKGLIDELNRTISFDPSNLNARITLAYVYKNSGSLYWDKSMEEYQKAIEIRPDEAFLHNSLGVMYRQVGRLEDAKKEWEKAIDIDPNYLNAYYNLSEFYLSSGDLKNADWYKKKFEHLKSKLSHLK